MKFNLTPNHIDKGDALTSSTIHLPSGPIKASINTEYNTSNKDRCEISGWQGHCVLINNGFFGSYYMCGDILITVNQMGYDLTVKKDRKKIKEDKEKIKSECLRLRESNQELFLDAASHLDLEQIISSLTQKQVKKYSGYENINLDDLSNEIESFFTGQKFGYLAEVKPQVFIDSDSDNNKMIKCFTAKTLVKTWGNTSETAVNVILKKNNNILNVYCGYTGNKGVLSGQGIAGAVLTGGVSLIGNAASAAKDKKMVDSTLKYIDELLSNVFKENSSNTIKDSSNDILSQIEKLSELKEKGILTEDEFNAKKTDLLAKM